MLKNELIVAWYLSDIYDHAEGHQTREDKGREYDNSMLDMIYKPIKLESVLKEL